MLRSIFDDLLEDGAAAEVLVEVGVFVYGVGVVLSCAEGDGGDAFDVEEVGVESAVGDVGFTAVSEFVERLEGGLDDGVVFGDTEGVVILLSMEGDFSGFADVVGDGGGGLFEAVLDGVGDFA